jgi:Tol biopolymer transport system component
MVVAVLMTASRLVAEPAAYAAPTRTQTERASIGSDGTQGDAPSMAPSVSADGRFVAFYSLATNLVAGDINNSAGVFVADVFVRDRASGATERVSVGADGTQGNSASVLPSISGDGQFVAFYSWATNLVPDDNNDNPDVFVHDRASGITERASVASDQTAGNGWSGDPSLSRNGRFVAFCSFATNLVPGDTNGKADVFVRDRARGRTERMSVASNGAEGNGDSFSSSESISANGRFVAFESAANNLVPADTNDSWDVFVHDRATGVTERVSAAADGAQGDGASFAPSISVDGRYVAFVSYASNLVPGDTNGRGDVFVHDRATGLTERVSVASDGTQGNFDSVAPAPSISADGRFVAFYSFASTLVTDDTNDSADVFVRDRATGVTMRVSVASDGTPGDATSFAPAISADGSLVAFESAATNLAPSDTNGTVDVFVRGIGAGAAPAGDSNRPRAK